MFFFILPIADLKVDVHRKNSSGSSDGEMQPGPSRMVRRTIPIREFIHEDVMRQNEYTPQSSHMSYLDEGDFFRRDSDRLPDRFLAKVRKIRTRFQRQTSFDSTGSGLNNYPVRRPRSSHHLYPGNLFPSHLPTLSSTMGEYLDRNFTTKSEMTIEMPSTSDRFPSKRKDSTSTMSAIQLSSTSAGPSTSQQHQNQPATHNIHFHRQHILPTVRRIKSSALDQPTAQQQSFSNLSPHPNSVETINGRTLRNPPHAIIPPPSSLVRFKRRWLLCFEFSLDNRDFRWKIVIFFRKF